MIIIKYDAPPVETAAERYDRDWLNIPDLDTAGKDDDRHDRTLLQQPTERKSRRYVDDGVSAVTGGSPVFDPTIPGDSTPVDPGDSSGTEPLWVDNFEGPELGSEWVSRGVAPLLSPLTVDPSGELESMVQIFRTFYETEYQIDLIGDFSSGTMQPSTGAGALIIQGVTLMTILSEKSGLVEHTLDHSPSKLTIRREDGVTYILADDALIASEVVESLVGDDGMDALSLNLVLKENGSPKIQSVSFIDLSTNGGGTPEEPSDPEVPVTPEVPEEPEAPEVPEGSYQEIYTETY